MWVSRFACLVWCIHVCWKVLCVERENSIDFGDVILLGCVAKSGLVKAQCGCFGEW